MASMVEQFNNLKGSKQQGEVQRINRTVEITAPILDYEPGMTAPPPKARSKSRSPERMQHNLWKNNPIFGSNEELLNQDDDDVPDIIKRLSQNGIPSGNQLSDTLSSDMIVNSISNGVYMTWQILTVFDVQLFIRARDSGAAISCQ